MAISDNRISILARQKNAVFHTSDLARLWGITNTNSLYTLLKRYNEKGILLRIYKGLYSLRKPEDLDPLLLGAKALHSYCYVSTETILVNEGVITQMDYEYTFISEYSRKFEIGENRYRSRQLQKQYLFNSEGIYKKNGILMATPERALADLLYFHPDIYLDGIKLIDLRKLNDLQSTIGYNLTTKDNVNHA